MNYTKEHYQLMVQLQSGVLWNDLSNREQEILQYLDSEGLAEPRAYTQDGLWVLTQNGEATLCAHRTELLAQENQTKKDTEKIAYQKTERAFQIFLVFLGAIIGNIDRLVLWIVSLF